MTKKLLLANIKGGVGKSTSVISICSAMSKRGLKVLAVDWDLQGSLTEGLKIPSGVTKTIADAIREDLTFEQIRCKTYDPNIDLIPNDVSLAETLYSLQGRARQFHLFKKLFESPALSEYDYLVADTAPHLDAQLQSALGYVDHYIIPAFAEKQAFAGIGFLTDIATQVKQDLNPNLNLLGTFFCNLKKTSANQRAIEREVTVAQQSLDLHIFETRIPHSDAIGNSYSKGISIIDHQPNLAVSQAYVNLTDEILTAIANHKHEPRTFEEKSF